MLKFTDIYKHVAEDLWIVWSESFRVFFRAFDDKLCLLYSYL